VQTSDDRPRQIDPFARVPETDSRNLDDSHRRSAGGKTPTEKLKSFGKGEHDNLVFILQMLDECGHPRGVATPLPADTDRNPCHAVLSRDED